jgi:tetratricopeptide (TPR) repeat protein
MRAGGDTRGLLRALNRRASLMLVAGDLAGAENTLLEARALARADNAGDGAALIMSTADLGDAQHARGRFAEAEASWRELVDTSLRVNGAQHRVSLVFQTMLGNFLFETGRSEEARALHRAVRAMVRAGQFESWWIGNLDHLMARTLYDRGQPQAMHDAQILGVNQLRTELPRSGALAQRERMMSEILVALGRLDEAEAMLAQARARWLAFMEGELRAGSMNAFHLAAAKLHLARGETTLALSVLAEVRPAAGIEPGSFDLALMRRDTLLAETLRRQGDHERAEQSVRQALLRLRDVPSPYRIAHHEAEALTVLGRVQQARGDLGGALASLTQAVALRRAQEEPDSVWLAESQAALDACRRALGRRH